MTPGQTAYEADLARKPEYHNGQKRPAWEDLDEIAQGSWERNPTARKWGEKE